MAEAFASAFLCGIGGVVVFLAMLASSPRTWPTSIR